MPGLHHIRADVLPRVSGLSERELRGIHPGGHGQVEVPGQVLGGTSQHGAAFAVERLRRRDREEVRLLVAVELVQEFRPRVLEVLAPCKLRQFCVAGRAATAGGPRRRRGQPSCG